MRKEIAIKFTKAEIRYLLELIFANTEKGIYWGRKDHFEKRQNEVAGKLRKAIGY